MEKHKCKLCFRSFSNGRALGGHMRSHMLNLPVPPKLEAEEPPPPPPQPKPKPPPPPPPAVPELSDSAESASSSSSEEEEEEEETEEIRELLEDDDEKGLYYGLRENPKRSIRLVDPEFSFAVDAGSVILQDRESETESSKNPTRRRSKRTRKSGMLIQHHPHLNHHNLQYQQYQKAHQQDQDSTDSLKKIKLSKLSNHKTESWAEPEPVSSVSDATTEEDVAFCLMMLSRDKWKKQEEEEEEDHERDEEHEEEKSMEESDESEEQLQLQLLKSSSRSTHSNRTRGKYKCETCKKVFKSYQALGGHRASHKKIRVSNVVMADQESELMEQENHNAAGTSTSVMAEKKIHVCPVCFRVFSSGQALGGHKRSHVTGSLAPAPITNTTTTTPVKSSNNKLVDSLIDLNLPAPVEDDEISQIELSAVSDAEFVNPIRH